MQTQEFASYTRSTSWCSNGSQSVRCQWFVHGDVFKWYYEFFLLCKNKCKVINLLFFNDTMMWSPPKGQFKLRSPENFQKCRVCSHCRRTWFHLFFFSLSKNVQTRNRRFSQSKTDERRCWAELQTLRGFEPIFALQPVRISLSKLIWRNLHWYQELWRFQILIDLSVYSVWKLVSEHPAMKAEVRLRKTIPALKKIFPS